MKIFNRKNEKPLFKKIIDTLSFFEIPHEYQLLVLEYHLRECEKNPDLCIDKDNKLILGNNTYDKIVLCPLVIDFGHKDIGKVEFNFSPKRPITNQTGDLFYAIRTYFRFGIDVIDKEQGLFKLSDEIKDWYKKEVKEQKIFEIYPFMGIDTQNYSLKDLKKLLDKYFRTFSKNDLAEDRRNKLFDKMGMFDSNLYRDRNPLSEEEIKYLENKHISPDYQYAFAGIKFYPQLGFDPYPNNSDKKIPISEIQKLIEEENWKEEWTDWDTPLNKVRFLYQYCIEKRIPVTTHCSDGGYKTKDDNDNLTSPAGKWEKVLADFPNLTLNFAHFGRQKNGKTEWRNKIIEFINNDNYPNIYTDISCNDMSPKYYKKLADDLKSKGNTKLQNHLLFGSDFAMSLLATDSESYDQSLTAFTNANFGSQDFFCHHNAEKFLFGGQIEND
ncbi:MAG: amidohydrolase family protein [Prevotellaceae bacterium]|nr:amidohydrolase family protein [Prevotellaceae bacterium]